MADYDGAGQIGVNDLLLARGVGGGAYGGFGGGFLGSGAIGGTGYLTSAALADGTSSSAKQDNMADTLRFGFDNSLEVARESRNIDQFGRVTDNQFRAELRASDQLAALTAQVAANARDADKSCCDTKFAIADAAKDAAKCCCDAQLEAAKNHGAVLAKMEEIDARNIERSLNQANAELMALKTQVACGCCSSWGSDGDTESTQCQGDPTGGGDTASEDQKCCVMCELNGSVKMNNITNTDFSSDLDSDNELEVLNDPENNNYSENESESDSESSIGGVNVNVIVNSVGSENILTSDSSGNQGNQGNDQGNGNGNRNSQDDDLVKMASFDCEDTLCSYEEESAEVKVEVDNVDKSDDEK